MIIIISTGTEKGQNFYSCDLKGLYLLPLSLFTRTDLFEYM